MQLAVVLVTIEGKRKIKKLSVLRLDLTVVSDKNVCRQVNSFHTSSGVMFPEIRSRCSETIIVHRCCKPAINFCNIVDSAHR